MNYNDLVNYIKHSEEMILPSQVARVNQGASFLQKLPLKLQKRIAAKGAEKNPYMGFVVEPYCFFLAYEIKDKEAATSLLPKGYKLVPVSMFAGGKPRFAAILGAFNIHTSVFWGSRVELYLIAENERTGMMSWIIAGYESNTISFDPGQGFIPPTTSRSVVTTSYQGEVLVDVQGAGSGNRIALAAKVEGAPRRPLDQRLWVEGNLSIDYGGELEGGDSQPFQLIFDPGEMESAWDVPLGQVRVAENTLGASFLDAAPFEAACFPYAQHFITTNVPVDVGIKDARGLEGAALRLGSKRGE